MSENLAINILTGIFTALFTAIVTVAKLKIHILYIKDKAEDAREVADKAHERIDKIPHP